MVDSDAKRKELIGSVIEDRCPRVVVYVESFLQFRPDIAKSRYFAMVDRNLLREHIEWPYLQPQTFVIRDDIERYIDG